MQVKVSSPKAHSYVTQHLHSWHVRSFGPQHEFRRMILTQNQLNERNRNRKWQSIAVLQQDTKDQKSIKRAWTDQLLRLYNVEKVLEPYQSMKLRSEQAFLSSTAKFAAQGKRPGSIGWRPTSMNVLSQLFVSSRDNPASKSARRRTPHYSIQDHGTFRIASVHV